MKTAVKVLFFLAIAFLCAAVVVLSFAIVFDRTRLSLIGILLILGAIVTLIIDVVLLLRYDARYNLPEPKAEALNSLNSHLTYQGISKRCFFKLWNRRFTCG